MEVIYLGTKITREQWLNRGIEQLKPLFIEAGYSIPDNYMISCGWPSREIKRAIGQCFDPELTENGTCHLFVSPVLENPVRILDVIIHEVCHHVVGVKEKHGRKFIKLIRALGLDGKPTATFAGPELKEKLVRIADKLGPYPHPAIKLPGADKPKAPSKRLKLISPAVDDYNVWISPTFLEEYGPPICPISGEPMIVEDKERMEERKRRNDDQE
jgi:hypothetical protein